MLYVLKYSVGNAIGDFCRPLITFANSLDPDQDRFNVAICFDTLQIHSITVIKEIS